MYLEKRKKYRKLKYILLVVITLNLIIIGFVSKNNYQNNSFFNSISELLLNNVNEDADIKLEVLINNKKANYFPSKDKSTYDGYECDNTGKVTFDEETWSAKMELSEPSTCILKFTSAEVLEDLSNKHICEKVGNTYYDKNGNLVTQDEYIESCVTNPQTGRFITISIILIALLSIVIFIVVKKNKRIYKL